MIVIICCEMLAFLSFGLCFSPFFVPHHGIVEIVHQHVEVEIKFPTPFLAFDALHGSSTQVRKGSHLSVDISVTRHVDTNWSTDANLPPEMMVGTSMPRMDCQTLSTGDTVQCGHRSDVYLDILALSIINKCQIVVVKWQSEDLRVLE